MLIPPCTWDNKEAVEMKKSVSSRVFSPGQNQRIRSSNRSPTKPIYSRKGERKERRMEGRMDRWIQFKWEGVGGARYS